MQYTLCRHIKTNGLQCQSPALRRQELCFFHARLHQRHAGFRHTDSAPDLLVPGRHIELAPLEDRESVQVALSVVINALATGQLETSRATAILYGLQLASNNAARLGTQPSPAALIASTPTAELSEDPTLAGVDLAEPGAEGTLPSWEDFDDTPDEVVEDERDEEIRYLRSRLEARIQLFTALGRPEVADFPGPSSPSSTERLGSFGSQSD